MDKDDLISDMLRKLSNNVDKSLTDLRKENHDNYYSLDVEFLKNVDKRYLEEACTILDKYNLIEPLSLLDDNMETAISNKNIIELIKQEIISFKEKVRKDLMTVIDYVDRKEEKLDLSKVSRDNLEGILILNKYEAYKLYSSDLDLNNINSAMRKQFKRLIYLKELYLLIDKYHNSKTVYNKDNTHNLINNLYIIVSKYIFLLTDSEFQFTKEAIKKILSYNFDFIDTYLYTYKIIITKIWNSEFTGDYYFVCDLDLNKEEIYLMTHNNMKDYWNSGYICDIPDDFIDYFHMIDIDIINFPLPDFLNKKYELNLKDFDKESINLKALYTKKDKIDFDSFLPVLYLNKNKNSDNN